MLILQTTGITPETINEASSLFTEIARQDVALAVLCLILVIQTVSSFYTKRADRKQAGEAAGEQLKELRNIGKGLLHAETSIQIAESERKVHTGDIKENENLIKELVKAFKEEFLPGYHEKRIHQDTRLTTVETKVETLEKGHGEIQNQLNTIT